MSLVFLFNLTLAAFFWRLFLLFFSPICFSSSPYLLLRRLLRHLLLLSAASSLSPPSFSNLHCLIIFFIFLLPCLYLFLSAAHPHHSAASSRRRTSPPPSPPHDLRHRHRHRPPLRPDPVFGRSITYPMSHYYNGSYEMDEFEDSWVANPAVEQRAAAAAEASVRRSVGALYGDDLRAPWEIRQVQIPRPSTNESGGAAQVDGEVLEAAAMVAAEEGDASVNGGGQAGSEGLGTIVTPETHPTYRANANKSDVVNIVEEKDVDEQYSAGGGGDAGRADSLVLQVGAPSAPLAALVAIDVVEEHEQSLRRVRLNGNRPLPTIDVENLPPICDGRADQADISPMDLEATPRNVAALRQLAAVSGVRSSNTPARMGYGQKRQPKVRGNLRRARSLPARLERYWRGGGGGGGGGGNVVAESPALKREGKQQVNASPLWIGNKGKGRVREMVTTTPGRSLRGRGGGGGGGGGGRGILAPSDRASTARVAMGTNIESLPYPQQDEVFTRFIRDKMASIRAES